MLANLWYIYKNILIKRMI